MCGGVGESTSLQAAGGRRRSSGDFDFYSPGDLLTHAAEASLGTLGGKKRAVPPLLKRNTIADFANTRAYQESTASLISATDQGQQVVNICRQIAEILLLPLSNLLFHILTDLTAVLRYYEKPG